MSLYIYAENAELHQLFIDQVKKWRPTDSGFDIPMLGGGFEPGHARPISLGIRVAAQCPAGHPIPILLLPRSSIANTPMRLANSIGLIDMGYRGEVLAKVDVHTRYLWNAGTRLFQLCRGNFEPWDEIILVDGISSGLPSPPDDRGNGGFGSTGK